MADRKRYSVWFMNAENEWESNSDSDTDNIFIANTLAAELWHSYVIDNETGRIVFDNI